MSATWKRLPKKWGQGVNALKSRANMIPQFPRHWRTSLFANFAPAIHKLTLQQDHPTIFFTEKR